MQNAGSGRGVASHPAVTSPEHPWRQTELSTVPWDVSGHCHLHVGFSLGTEKEGSRSACPAPCAPAAKLGQPSLHSEGFPVTPDPSGVLSRRRIPGSPSGCPRGVEQTKRCWAVLSCSSLSGDGHGKTSSRNLLLFLPSPSPSETFCAWFFPALQSPVRQDGAWDTGAGLGGCGDPPLPCRVRLSPVLLQPGLLGKLCCFGMGKGKDWQTGLGPMALPSNPRLWHNLVLLHAHGCALCSGKPCWKCSGQCLSPTHTWALWPQRLEQLQTEPLQVPGQDGTVPAAPGPALELPNIQASL